MKLPVVNMLTVQVCSGFSWCNTDERTARYRGSQLPCGWGTVRIPTRPVTGRHSLFPVSLTGIAFSRSYDWATQELTHCTTLRCHTGLPRSATFTDRLRTLLCAGWDIGCVGSPSILTDLLICAILALEPKGSSRSAPFTTRKRRFRSLVLISHFLSIFSVLLTFNAVIEYLRPHRFR